MPIYDKVTVLTDEKVREFLNIRDKQLSPGTIKNYISILTNYSKAIEKLPSEWIQEADNEMDAGIKRDERKINKYFEIFLENMKNDDKSEITISRSFTDIKTFYRYFKIDTPNNPVKRTVKHDDNLITKEELKRAVRNANTRDKAIILLCMSSGIGIKEIINLTYLDFLEALGFSENVEIHQLKERVGENFIPIWNLKNRNGEYITFSTPESVRGIIDYLIERHSSTKWLFTGQNQKEKMFEGTLVNAFARLNDKLRLGIKESGRRRLTSQAFREYFEAQLKEAEVDPVKIKYMMGLKIPEDINFDASKLKKDYKKALSDLSLEPVKVHHINEQILEELESRIKELESIVEQQKNNND